MPLRRRNRGLLAVYSWQGPELMIATHCREIAATPPRPSVARNYPGNISVNQGIQPLRHRRLAGCRENQAALRPPGCPGSACAARQKPERIFASGEHRWAGSSQRDGNPKAAADPRGALGGKLPAHQLDELPDQRQAQPHAADAASGAANFIFKKTISSFLFVFYTSCYFWQRDELFIPSSR